MKLRNKKTGEITIARKIGFERYTFNEYTFNSLADLNEEWEDYKPAEPLINDKEIRKVIRAWADANGDDGRTRLEYCSEDNRLSTDSDCIEFNFFTPFRKLKDGATYTIYELCGEEEE